jgi:exodeoxyribonuclease VII small subunit
MESLEALVHRMESGELSLEESLQEFEQGMILSKQCQTLLDESEQRVKILTAQGQTQDFENLPHDDE